MMHAAVYSNSNVIEKDAKRLRPCVSILGIRGVPAGHGGFETFTARLAPQLVSSGWDVTVYCQEDEAPPAAPSGPGHSAWESTWEGVKRVHLQVGPDTPLNSIKFDLRCIADVLERRPDLVLILGYNTAIFALRLRLAGIPTVFIMDGVEWQRDIWGLIARAWLYMNDWAACLIACHLIADHPQIERHLESRVRRGKITVIPYGADILEPAPDDPRHAAELRNVGLSSMKYATLIARAEPENSVLELVRAFSARPRGIKLAVLGSYEPNKVAYHAKVLAAAGPEVIFLGAIYDISVVQNLRRHCLLYLHGHRVGGCNPSLLEAMGAGNPVLAHRNRFNCWVAGQGARYFLGVQDCDLMLTAMLRDPAELLSKGQINRRRAGDIFNWSDVLQSYGELLADARSGVVAGGFHWGRRPHWQLDGDVS